MAYRQVSERADTSVAVPLSLRQRLRGIALEIEKKTGQSVTLADVITMSLDKLDAIASAESAFFTTSANDR